MGWLTGWKYRKSHAINAAAGAGTNYQVKITVHYGAGVDSDNDVYLNNKCRTDFGDIRFTKADGQTLLDYWMESKVDSDNAVFWIEIVDSLSTVARTIYVYYGKSTATTISNGSATFLQFDHFDDGIIDTNIWDILGVGTAVESGTIVDIHTTTSWGWKRLIDKIQRQKDNKCVEMRFAAVSCGGESCGTQNLCIYTDTMIEETFPLFWNDRKMKIGLRQGSYSSVLWFNQAAGTNEVTITNGRQAQRLTIPNKYIHSVSFKLRKVAGATGTVTCTIRKVSDDSIIETSSTTIDVATGLTTSFAWYSFAFADPLVNEEVRVSVEAAGTGDIRACSNNGDVSAGVLSLYPAGGPWADYALYDSTTLIYEWQYSEAWNYPCWVGTVARNFNTFYRMRIYWKSLKARIIIYDDDWTNPESTDWLDVVAAPVGDFYFGAPANGDEGQWDYYLMRNFVDPEPAHGTWGNEEEKEPSKKKSMLTGPHKVFRVRTS